MIFDYDDALSRAMDDPAFLKEMIDHFLHQVEDRLKEIQGAAHKGDFDDLQKKSHSFKGTAATLSAKNICSQALLLEDAGKAEDISLGKQAFNALLDSVEEFKAHIRELDQNAFFIQK